MAGRLELKVPLGSRTYITPESFPRYEEAKRRYQREVKAAAAARELHEKEAAGRHDALTDEQVSYLADVFQRDWHIEDEEALRTRGDEWADKAKRGWDTLFSGYREWRATGDMDAMEERWGRAADALLAAEGLRVSSLDADSRSRLLWVLNGAAIQYSEQAEAHIAFMVVDVPPRPERPANPKGRGRSVSALLNAYTAAKWDGWSQSSRKAIAPVVRLLRDAIGGRDAGAIDRTTVREIFELVKRLPVNLGKIKALRGLSVPNAIEEAQRRQ